MRYTGTPDIPFVSLSKYDFSKLDDSGGELYNWNYMLHCILFEKKCGLNEVIPHGTRSFICPFGLQHFNKCHAYDYSQINMSMNKFLAHLYN